MRVALVIERFEPRGGGVENVAWCVARGLAAAGDEVSVFARRAAPCPELRVHELRVPAAWQPLRVLAFSRAAARAAPRGGAFDVVHSFSRTRHQDVYRAGGGSHAAYLERRYGPLGRRLRRLSPRHAVLLAIEERVLRDPTQLVQCNSEMVRDELRARYAVPAERLAVIPNGVDRARFGMVFSTAMRQRSRDALGQRGGPVWLLAGSGFERKGLDVALRALAQADPPDAVLWVAGRDEPGPWRRLAARLGVAERVFFLGPRDDLPALYAVADALVLPTRYDAFANVCLEAAAAGLPVLTSGANGAARFLGDALLVVPDPEDVGGFAGALRRLADPELRARLGALGRRRAEEASWESHVRALRELYRRVPRRGGA
jgi:UDP-glucose:(heptosyl)LPS alpha-1,3-glucosyltransferase